jgi:hypothetical protein
VGLAIIVGTVVLVQHLSLRPPTTTASIPPAQKLALPLPEIPSIAVLPFTNMSGDRDQEYFSDGITDDLITALSSSPSTRRCSKAWVARGPSHVSRSDRGAPGKESRSRKTGTGSLLPALQQRQ